MLAQLNGGMPDIDPTVTPYHGFIRCGDLAGWCGYLVSGTGAQLLAIDALPGIVGLVAVTEDGDVKWPELAETIAAAVRTKLNTWLTNHGQQTIPADWAYRRVIRELYERMNPDFDLDNFDVAKIEG